MRNPLLTFLVTVRGHHFCGFIVLARYSEQSYLAIQPFTQFSPDPYQVIISPCHYDMRGAWVILCCVHKTWVWVKLDG